LFAKGRTTFLYGSSLDYESNKNDRDVVLDAIREYGCSIQFAGEELKNDLE
jgi:hypothetical protein